MYTCGPTVYDHQHIGNLRSHVSEDLFEKSFEYLGYKVTRAMVITDIGKLNKDGEDKIINAMFKEKKSFKFLTDFYTKDFRNDCEMLNIRWPEIVVPASSEIDMYIKMIQKLLKDGYAYKSNGNIYFDTSKCKNYYELVGNNTDSLLYNNEEDIVEGKNKKNSNDFALWFTNLNSKFGVSELQWDSPFGKGVPGWHIECSGIAIKYLGENLDIHFGSKGAVFPHHTNEIAQSESYLGHKWCNYWVHLSWLLVDNQKMSKSVGNMITLTKLKNDGYNPLSFRFFLLNTNYYDEVNFNYKLFEESSIKYNELLNSISDIEKNGKMNKVLFDKYDMQFRFYLEDNLNTIGLLNLLYELIKDTNVSGITKLNLINAWDKVLCLNLVN